LFGVAIDGVRDRGRGLVVFEGVDKLGQFDRRERGALVRWIGGCSGDCVRDFDCHNNIIARVAGARLHCGQRGQVNGV
jgi:hypothetical protein